MTSDLRQAVITVGSFDGVHLGHQAILAYLVERARVRGGVPTLVTFDPHPRQVVTGQSVPLLTTPAERAALVARHGVERTVILDFDRAMADMAAEQFVTSLLIGKVGMSCVVIGHDHGFGAGRRGNHALLSTMAPELGFEVDVIPAQLVGDRVVSSSLIRKMLAEEGSVEKASELLGRPYRWRGLVIEGDGRGRTIGFPTANLGADSGDKLVPRGGVYAVIVQRPDGTRLPGMMNIGTRPTFNGSGTHLEVHLLDFEGDLYGEILSVEFRVRLREERRFDGVDSLVEQLNRDRARCRDLLNGVL